MKLNKMNRESLFALCNSMGLLIITIISIMALVLQFALNELPCPLCQLQRIALFGIGFGYLLNLKYGHAAKNYAIANLFAIMALFVGGRQVLFNFLPGKGHYGYPLFGLHLYTWTFIIGFITLVINSILIYFECYPKAPSFKILNKIILIGYLLAIIVNIGNVFMQCRFSQCSGHDLHYQMLTIFEK